MKALYTLITLNESQSEGLLEYKDQRIHLKNAIFDQFCIMMRWCEIDCLNNDGELIEVDEAKMKAFLERKFVVGDIVMKTKHFTNGRRSRIVGYIVSEPELQPTGRKEGRWHVILHALPRSLADPIRRKYCEEYGYSYHTPLGDTYSDQFGYASHHISMDDTVVLGQVEIRGSGPWKTAYPKPGDRGYDLMF